ncbi:hypothetical protein MCOR07_005241 [Pyricularia oryzae]|nr:hypothetical protein MCOR19_001174 [Pyricularia oryzae]KAI6367109.1 hypothetical protein MCOR31_006187 [Pyricularia oryzae]KAI6402440.1 hypothetical protein MCOR20_007681 [Pyricularia oryzae]KAI6423800.1 hypothetical protein MCOR21_007956 [Pyricularia oryzae]KAI6465069.1 hypothetical protein MCOR15_003497 [Pyricularia oryzae]
MFRNVATSVQTHESLSSSSRLNALPSRPTATPLTARWWTLSEKPATIKCAHRSWKRATRSAVKVAGFVEPDEPARHSQGVRHEAQGDETGFPIGLEGTVQISPALGQIRTQDGHPAVSVALAVAVVWDAPYVKVEQKGLGDKMSPYEESHLGGQ